ncbi:uncharacterized protein LOC116258549 isoform X1 [Nymphaea colorata]|nr:uncharacterized protein LOC116258549 isoform X1 [Nymphaea colorata]
MVTRKRRRRSGEHPLVIDYRSPEDDGWYPVRLRLSGQTLTLRYVGFSSEYNEWFSGTSFRASGELEAFQRRFRRTTVQLQDGQCRQVAEGMTVSALHRNSEGDVTFYDAVVKKVCTAEHKVVDGEEECCCTFVLLWQHGRAAGSTTCANVGDICLLEHGNEQIHPLLDAFLHISQEKLDHGMQSLHSDPECDFSDRSQPIKVPNDAADKTASPCGADVQFSVKITEDVDGGSGKMYERETLTKCYYFIIENLERDLTATSIMDFIHYQTSVQCSAVVSPVVATENYARGVVILEGEECFKKVAGFLEDPNHIIMSVSGRPWVIMEHRSGTPNMIYGSLGLNVEERNILQKSEELPQNLKLVHKGTQEYIIGLKQKDLFMEFQHHLEGLHKRLEKILCSLSCGRG